MKTDFLCKCTLPRGSCIFLKMVVTVTALLCCQLVIYGQVAQTDIEIYECSSIANVTGGDNIDLGGYSEVTRKKLKYDSNGNGNEDSDVVDLSGVTYSPFTGTLFMIINKGPNHSASDKDAKIYEFSVDGDYIRTIDLLNEEDTEDIVHLYEDKFAIVEEKQGKVLVITIIDSEYDAVIDLANPVSATSLPASWSPTGDDGIEGVTYEPTDGTIHFVTEVTMEWYSYDGNNPGSPPMLNGNCDLASNIFNIDDLSAIHHLRLTKGLDYLDVDNHVLLLSDESNVLLEVNEDCSVHEVNNVYTPYGSLQLEDVYDNENTQLEGVTMDDCGNIYVVGEPNHFFVYSNTDLVLNPLGTPIYDSNTAVTEELEPNTQYCWRTKYSDECLWSPFSSFITPGSCTTVEALLTESQISSGDDDVEEAANGNIDFTSSDLELVYESSQQKIGLLFRDLGIPRGAIITNAYIQFTVDEVDTGTDVTSLEIAAHDIDDAPLFSNTNVSSRPLTNARVAWKPTEWTSAGTAGADQRTPDISSIVQEVVNRPAWDDTSSKLAIIITGTQGSRIAESYQGAQQNSSPPDAEPIIYVDYIVTTPSNSCDASCTTTQFCDDNDPCTKNDMETVASDGTVCIPCAGIAIPDCSGSTSVVACNDNDPCTMNDVQTVDDCDNSICVPCAGTAIPDCSGSTSVVACNDNDPCTMNDIQTVDDCDGSICVPCAGTAIPDCSGSTSVQTCDDGDPCTENDVETIDDCDGSVCIPCAGTLIDENGNEICDADDCLIDLTIIQIDVPGDYNVSNLIKTDDTQGASVIVNTNEHLELSGGNRVRLNNGFSVTSGASLRADNEDCNQQ